MEQHFLCCYLITKSYQSKHPICERINLYTKKYLGKYQIIYLLFSCINDNFLYNRLMIINIIHKFKLKIQMNKGTKKTKKKKFYLQRSFFDS